MLSNSLNLELSRYDLACHSCDNPLCCNPSHLFIGTHKNNTDDMMNKRRHHSFRDPQRAREIGLRNKQHLPRFEGETHPNVKLTEKEVLEIRAMYVPRKVTLKFIGAKYGIDFTTVSDIIRRKSWTHI